LEPRRNRAAGSREDLQRPPALWAVSPDGKIAVEAGRAMAPGRIGSEERSLETDRVGDRETPMLDDTA
jgi:hypothetical protein